MKRFVYNTVAFSLLATLFVVLMTMLLGGNERLRNVNYHLGMWDFTYTRIVDASQTRDVDILFLGSSHCYRTFDPRFYEDKGLSTFNLGSSNQTPIQSEMLLRLFLDSLNPRMVVVEVHPDVISLEGVESAIYLTNNMKPSWPMARMALQTRNIKAILTMLYSASHNLLCPSFNDYADSASDGVNRYVSGGFVEHCEAYYQPEPLPQQTITIQPVQMRALRSMLRMLEKRQIPCMLVETPDTRCKRSRYVNHDEFLARMEALGNFRSVNVSQLDDSLHFFDAEHLNQAGVELFQEYFYDSVLQPFMNKNFKR